MRHWMTPARTLLHMDAPLSHTPVVPAQVADQVRLARNGSQSAFAWLHRRFLPLVHGILLGRHRPALADELTQECFVKAFAQLHQLRDATHFGPWIAAMARRMRPSSSWLEAALPLCQQSPQCHDHDGPDQHTEALQLLRAIGGLPEAYRETLLLRLVEGLSGAEIAALTRLTPESVRVNLHRGMEKLRLALHLQRDGRLS